MLFCLRKAYLCLREHEAGSDFEALGSGQILVLSELLF
jgi:hypothetical protein